MSYLLKEITIRTNNTVEGMEKIEEVWKDINSGKLPLLFDSEGLFHKEFLLYQDTVIMKVMKMESMISVSWQ